MKKMNKTFFSCDDHTPDIYSYEMGEKNEIKFCKSSIRKENRTKLSYQNLFFDVLSAHNFIHIHWNSCKPLARNWLNWCLSEQLNIESMFPEIEN